MRKYQEKITNSLFSVINTGKHGWAQSETMSCENGIAKSYRTPIAKVTYENGKWKCYLNKKRYSCTTSTQQSAIKLAASRRGVEVVEVEPNEL